MKELDKSKMYNLSELNSKELKEIWVLLKTTDVDWSDCEFGEVINESDKSVLCFNSFNWEWDNSIKLEEATNAKELFYTLENIQVDCRELSEEQINNMKEVVVKNGYDLWDNETSFEVCDKCYYFTKSITNDKDFLITRFLDKTTITYDKFMELFSNKEENFKKLVEVLNEELTEEAYEVSYIAEKPKQYQIGIDTFNPQPHYNNENGSLYKIANDLGLNHWEFDIFKRLVRCRKKNQFKEDLQKIKDTIDIYLNEFTDER